MKPPRFIVRFWPVIMIVLAWAAVVLSNFTPGTWLTGWDNLHPEFDFFLNIKRSLSAVWQEYQGPGLVGGMGHAADLPRQLLLWAASGLIPAHLLRWTWTFFMLLAGTLGVYALIHAVIQYRTPIDNNNATALKLSKVQFAALIGGLFYLFNLNTVQVFTAPFDAFVTHYGVLPWLLWSNWKFLHDPSRKTLFLVALINVIGMTHAYIPTLFLVYLIILSCLSVATLIRSFHRGTFARIMVLGLVTFCINAFWLLPFTYFTVTKSPVTVGAKINAMATEEIYLQNKAFGDIGNVATLKSYWFDTADYNPTLGALEPVLGYWRNLDRTGWIMGSRYALVVLIFFGGIIGLLHKNTRVWGVLGMIAVGMVAVDTPPFVWVMDWLRNHIPLLSQFFRFPFTKWGTALALCYSVWLGIGIAWGLDRLKTHGSKVLRVIVVLVPITLSILGSIGMLQGQLISTKFKLTIPDEYFQLFTKLKSLPAGRIANLPQNTFWGWTYYRWGYSGSGFLWYGVEQPILDRAFDVWTREGEQYYWEISRALYSKDVIAVDAVLRKYDVRYVLLDDSVVSPSSDRGLFLPETKELLSQMTQLSERARFGSLTLYEHIRCAQCERASASQSFVSLSASLPLVSPSYHWTDNDVAYARIGDYIATGEPSTINNQQSTITYPFRSLFTKRSVNEREFMITETPDAITIGSVTEATGASILKTDALVYDSTRSADLVAENVQPCGVLREGTASAINIDQFLRFTSRNQRGCLSFSVSDLPHREGYLVAVESRHVAGRPLLISLINQTAKHVELETYLQETRDKRQETGMTWKTDYFVLPPLAPDGLGYTVYLSNDAIGRQESINDIKYIKFYRIPYQELVSMRTGNPQPQGTFDELSVNPAPPSSRSAGLRRAGLSVDVDTVSHSNPAYYRVSFQSSALSSQLSNCLTTDDCGLKTLVLSQSFDPGWKAYTIETCNKGQETSKRNFLSPISCLLSPYLPFFFGRELKDHVLVNNWANAWLIRSDQSDQFTNPTNEIVIFFLPQLLQWIGFFLFLMPFFFLFTRPKL